MYSYIHYLQGNNSAFRKHLSSYMKIVSLSTVVLNSRDQHKNTWRPAFTRLHNKPHNILYPEKLTEMHW